MDYIFAARNLTSGTFGSNPGPTRFLEVPANAAAPTPAHTITKRDWFDRVIHEAKHDPTAPGRPVGDVLVYIHGFNNDPAEVLKRHRLIRTGLAAHGYMGAVVSFDWPSASSALNYLDDRSDAKLTALRLVTDGIAPFSRVVQQDCDISVHILAHSMGAFVTREAFDDADDRPAVAATGWTVSQVMFCGADVSQGSMADGPTSSSLYRHCVRLTNYFNPYDSVLSISGAKRVGVAPRVGRVGLPGTAPTKAVNVNTGDYYDANRAKFDGVTNADHAWFFHDKTFLKDVFFTIQGDLDRNVIPTRRHEGGVLQLKG
ncbi:MAG: alpha/beta hydrolase [Rhodobacteraceae bacterium]|nr:alpha/beta hydrolase [Paracoccaceae bacterium]